MSLAGVEGPDPTRASATAPSAPATAPAPVAPAAAGGAGASPQRDRADGGFDAPELTSGLLSDNVTPWQREGLGRLGRLLRMQPRDVLSALRRGTNLGQLLAARRLTTSALVGRFDKGLLIDAQA